MNTTTERDDVRSDLGFRPPPSSSTSSDRGWPRRPPGVFEDLADLTPYEPPKIGPFYVELGRARISEIRAALQEHREGTTR